MNREKASSNSFLRWAAANYEKVSASAGWTLHRVPYVLKVAPVLLASGAPTARGSYGPSEISAPA
jgi:hypothetical protein